MEPKKRKEIGRLRSEKAEKETPTQIFPKEGKPRFSEKAAEKQGSP